MKLSRAAIALYIALVFGSGVLLGAFGHRLYMVSTVIANKPSPEEFRKRMVAEYQSRLNWIRRRQHGQGRTPGAVDP
jgi:hypothetical protein